MAKHQRGSLPTPYAYISTCTYILVQISSATSLQANLFTHCALVSTEQFSMRLNWKMPFCCQWECCVRRVWFSLHQLDPETVKPVSSSTLDWDSCQLHFLVSIYFRCFRNELSYLGTVTEYFCFYVMSILMGKEPLHFVVALWVIFWCKKSKNRDWGVLGCLACILTPVFRILLDFVLSSQHTSKGLQQGMQ